MNQGQQSFDFDNRPTIKGFPELRWTGKRPYQSTVYYPAQLKERYGEEQDGWMNKIFWGDNLQVMSHLMADYRGKIDLIYIDPPFDSKADYKKKITLRGKSISSDTSSFEEKQYGDIWTNDEYLQFMYERLILCRELLSDKGVIYVHCDHRVNASLRLILNEIFGVENFRNEITWRRQVVRGMKKYASYYAFSADRILVFSKASQPVWHRQTTETLLTIEQAKAKYKEDEGGFFRTSDPGSYSFESLVALHKEGRLYIPKGEEIIIDKKEQKITLSNGKKPAVKYYREKRGKYVVEEKTVDNIWDDIPGMGVVSSEYLGYPTQKPIKLLERIIQASSNPGGIVFDCFMGSGTTQAVAMKLGRRFIGADINLGAIQTTTKRLLSIGESIENSGQASLIEDEAETKKYTGFEVYNVNNYDFFRNPLEAKKLLVEALEIQTYEQSNLWDGELGGRMVKIMPVNRIATKADLEELKANLPYKIYEKRKADNPGRPVEAITIVCMGHEADLKASLEAALANYKVDVEVVDILTDRKDLQFKREAEAEVVREGSKLVIRQFYPLNLMQKLSLQEESVNDWRELVDSVMIDWNYDGVVMEPTLTDIPDKNEIVAGVYDIPADAGTIKVKITDVLSESLEVEVD